ncbi:FAD binding domain-containing protein [Microbacterium sp. G2-8]|uniref:FAD binding domain-containing protein n=1 Tax=Microbacterium sp. G2-8 TaxID=2842454 RepID=UPI001C89459F|nr:FAD binding domain-containing protein [Microbacterium sp. G2-8]
MDLNTVTSYRRAASRADLALAPGEALLAGGTWLFSEPMPDVTGLVDLQTMGWPDIEETDGRLRIAATCTIARLVAYGEEHGIPLFGEAANALLASFKIWQTATVGGNIVRAYAAAAMTSMAVALDADAIVYTPDGGERRLPVAEIPTGDGTNSLGPGDVLRAIDIPARALRSRAVLRKEALADHGRSGAVVTGRVDADGSATFAITAATLTPQVRRFDALPDPGSLAHAVGSADGWYTDPLGSADWRRAISLVLAERIREVLR